jgi:esterase
VRCARAKVLSARGCRRALVVVSGLLLLASAAVAQTPVDRFVTVNALRIHYVDWGGADKPPMILLHGLDRVARTFDHLAPHFTSRYHVIAVDMRGHGDSDWDPAARYVVEDHVSDLEGLVAQLGLRNIVVWGNSTGGRVAQVFAGKHPELVSHVIAEDVGPERPQQISDNYVRRVREEEKGWDTELGVWFAAARANPRAVEAVVASLVHYGAKQRADGWFVWKRDPNLVKGFVATDLWRYVRAITAPTIYILGERSNIVPPETQDALRKALPRVQISTIEGAGHYPSDEKPADFVAIVDRFLHR